MRIVRLQPRCHLFPKDESCLVLSARAFVDALISPAMAQRWTAAGFEAPK
jgi:hypothetical protein